MSTRNTPSWIAVAETFHRSRVSGPESSAAWRPYDDLVRERLLRYTRRVLHRLPNDDEDAVQITLIRQREYDSAAPVEGELFRRWFFSIARSVCLNLLRSPHSRHVSLGDLDRPVPGPGTATQILRKDSNEKARAIATTLPGEEGVVIQMHYFEGRTVKTIARKLCDSTRQINRLLTAARERLKWKLIEAGLGDG